MLATAALEDSGLRPGVRQNLARRTILLVAWFLIVFYAVAGITWVLVLAGALDAPEFPKVDFFAFWAASSLALDGAAAAAYNFESIWRAQLQLPGDDGGYHPWRNPPLFFFLVLPLSLLPIAASIAAWMTATGAFLFAAVRRITTDTLLLMLAVAFPATLWNLLTGQTGFLIAGLFAWGMLLLRERPVLSGVSLALMALKPQFFPFVLVALIAGRYYKAALATVASLGVLSLASLGAFGFGAWEAFVSVARVSGDSIFSGEADLAKIQSLAAMSLVLGAPSSVAQVLQGVVVLAMAGFVAWHWRSDAAPQLKSAGLALAILLATPYVYHYDLTLLGLAALWIYTARSATGVRRLDGGVLLVAWLAPILHLVTGRLIDMSLTPAIELALLALVVRDSVWVEEREVEYEAVGR